nr:MAG TPA: hypothetical protein [Crassvirales sp.]
MWGLKQNPYKITIIYSLVFLLTTNKMITFYTFSLQL